MLSRQSLWMLGCLFILLVSSFLLIPDSAQSASPTVAAKITRQGGTVVITVQGESLSQGAYLGCSLYPKKIKNAAQDGVHNVVPVQGAFTKTWTVPTHCYGGTYEVSIWAQQVSKANCKIPNDPWCKRNGYHMEGMLAYKSGSIKISH